MTFSLYLCTPSMTPRPYMPPSYSALATLILALSAAINLLQSLGKECTLDTKRLEYIQAASKGSCRATSKSSDRSAGYPETKRLYPLNTKRDIGAGIYQALQARRTCADRRLRVNT